MEKSEIHTDMTTVRQLNVYGQFSTHRGPVMVAEIYVALANANPTVKDVHLKASGSQGESKCKNV
ncbi:hypothetical protein JYB87_12055 [Shewanella avicenniae]|uniref:Uncharacterized protein n=1 Tax=Shewanella avicenniae TaxID=2814294 RepID=A0ABX7QM85_9GAMM|nr:hypothetical protein [Shewanella avicenniae]QSX32499.1 hypothetical protein JYB87_12055 [Shewanella avicenniae]